jgi:hypothetical protein
MAVKISIFGAPYRNAGLMQPVHSVLGRDNDGAHEQGALFFDDDLNKLCELSPSCNHTFVLLGQV